MTKNLQIDKLNLILSPQLLPALHNAYGKCCTLFECKFTADNDTYFP